MTTLFINFLSISTILSGILTITAKNPVISVIYLIFTFVFAAGYLILLGIQFIGISYIIVYVGAIAVLFLFVIMMINIKLTDILETGTQYTKNLPLAITIGSLFLFILYKLMPKLFFSANAGLLFPAITTNSKLSNISEIALSINQLNNLNINNLSNLQESSINAFAQNNIETIIAQAQVINSDLSILNFLQIEVLGHTLYTYAAILLIILSFILLLAMFATIVITKR